MPAPAPRRPAAGGRVARSRRGSQGAGISAAGARVPVRAVGPGAGPAIKLGDPKAERDPRLKKALDRLDQTAARQRRHPPASEKAAQAQSAALPPKNERMAGAQANKVATMEGAETKKPDSGSFLDLLRAEIAKAMPKNLDETGSFMEGDSKRRLKDTATGNVDKQKSECTAGMKSASAEAPDTSGVAGKEVTPFPPEAAESRPSTVGASDAMPAPKPPGEISLDGSKRDAEQTMRDEEITTEQLNKANDPRFSAVVTARSDINRNADTAPALYRTQEQRTLTQAAARAVADEKAGLAGMAVVRGRGSGAVKERQLSAKQRDEARRKEVADTIEKIYTETKQSVDAKLDGLETEVTGVFDGGVEAAVSAMKQYVDKRKDEYKERRYSGFNKWKWLKDKLAGLPDEVKVFYEEGRKRFLADLDALIVRIAALVETRLKEAKDEVGKGQKRIGDYVEGLPKDLKAVGREAEREISGRFDELRRGIDDKKGDLAGKLAQRYKEATEKADAALKEMREKDKGLVQRFAEKIGEIIRILREFKAKVSAMLKKGKSAISLIVGDPIGFLKNLLGAIKRGISQFVDRIWEHLKAGFLAWLFGSLGEAGIQVPSDFSFASILQLVLQILGLTYQRIRARAVAIIGERNVALLERAFQLIAALIRGGPAAMWEQMKEYLGDLKAMLIQGIQEWVVTAVIKAAVIKLISMFNPVGAIIQAILAIYNTVMFFIERINQILQFVEAIINSVYAIATGNISAAANWIEQALARMIPLIISFLARLLGLSGITEKIMSIIRKIQTRVEQAVDSMIKKIVGGVKFAAAKGKAAVESVVAWWKARKQFRGSDGKQHSIYYAGEGRAARLMVASDVEKLSKFIDDASKRPENKEGKRKAHIEAVSQEAKALEKLANSQTDADVVHTEILAAFGRIAPHLGALFGGLTLGTKDNPYQIHYPKRRTSRYIPIYIGPKVSVRIPQPKLEAAAPGGTATPALEEVKKTAQGDPEGYKQWEKEGFKILTFKPHEAGMTLPFGGKTIGLSEEWRILEGKRFKLIPGSSTKGYLINGALKPYGYRSVPEDRQGDHVLEMQLGGKNVLENLWPLKSSENMKSGSDLKNMSFKLPDGTEKKMRQIKDEALAGKEIWMTIIDTIPTSD